MPSGGHNRLPSEVKRLRGTYEASRENPDAPVGERGIIPPSIELDQDVKREYRKLSKLLDDLGVLSKSDCGELESLALARVQIRKLQKKLFELIDNPMAFRRMQICLNDAIRLASALSSKFGLSPSDRGRVTVLPPPTDKNQSDKWGDDW